MLDSSLASSKLITIGVPVFNGGEFIGRALESIRLQTHENFKVLISDNASEDATQGICEAMARSDIRFEYLRQERNIGAMANFMFLIDRAETEHFVYLAADDYWEPEFLKENIACLLEGPKAVASISMVDFVTSGVFSHASHGDRSIEGTVTERLRQYLRRPTDNSSFYALFKQRRCAKPAATRFVSTPLQIGT